MKVKTEYINLKTDTRYAFVNITSQVRKIIEESKVQEGLCLVNTMHISSSIFINDNEDGLHEDFRKWLEESCTTQSNQSI